MAGRTRGGKCRSGAPDARRNVAPNDVNNNDINTSGSTNSTMRHPDGSTMNHDGMTKDERHKNTMCKMIKLPDINKSGNR